MRIECPELQKLHGIAHGFFTRRGGVSHGIYASLNCGWGSGDDLDKVAENRARVAKTLGAETVSTLFQIHSSKVITTNRPIAHEEKREGDALVTNTPGVAIGILTADCLPILLADEKARVIGAAHAGWKGAAGGVIEATLEAMKKLGATSIVATIGPGIAQGSYEVGEEFYARFLEQAPENRIYFLRGSGGHFLFDLPAYAKDRLKNAGISRINLLARDTCFNEDDFFSYRRATLRGEPAYGRQISAIMLKESL